MSVTPVTPPTPQNGDMERAMFVWIPTVGGTTDPLKSDTNMQSLLNFCSSSGSNMLFLDMYGYLGSSNFSTAHYQSVQKFVHYAHASGIKVMALAGNVDWGHNQQWVMTNIVRRVGEYNALCTGTFGDARFDGIMYDVEYWTSASYTSVEPIGLCDLVNQTRRVLNIPVGCFLTQWLANSGSAALTISYDEDANVLEGLALLHQCDHVAVACYSNISGTQEADLQPWFDNASTTGVGNNQGIWCTSLTDSGQPVGTSYWTGAAGAVSAMETQHTGISQFFKAAPNTNAVFRGQAIEQYSSYDQMS